MSKIWGKKREGGFLCDSQMGVLDSTVGYLHLWERQTGAGHQEGGRRCEKEEKERECRAEKERKCGGWKTRKLGRSGGGEERQDGSHPATKGNIQVD